MVAQLLRKGGHPDATHLAIGAVDQSVEVTATTPLLDLQGTNLGKIIPKNAIKDLPLFISGGLRANLAFVVLTPGVIGAATNPRIGGGLLDGQSEQLDGAESWVHSRERGRRGPSQGAWNTAAHVVPGIETVRGVVADGSAGSNRAVDPRRAGLATELSIGGIDCRIRVGHVEAVGAECIADVIRDVVGSAAMHQERQLLRLTGVPYRPNLIRVNCKPHELMIRRARSASARST
jgi:hypothetical protein